MRSSADVVHLEREIPDSCRFAFGRNWRRFLDHLDEPRICEGERSLRAMLGRESLEGTRLLDVGCGSGIFSLAAMRLGVQHVHSFDYDADSVACAEYLRDKFFPGTTRWSIERGSALDEAYISSLGTWDIVYSWGVLHHTGNMWSAIAILSDRVASGGTLFVSIYNDQGWISQFWKAEKRLYNTGPAARVAAQAVFFSAFVVRGLIKDLLLLRTNPFRRYTEYRRQRGMSVVHDWRDWLGGYPFEVAKPEEVIDFLKVRGFQLERLKTCGGGIGCNEYVLSRRL
jgi:2-polyprenyl-3-methyl-5-hydroxy-6-metoxy-1,4-benzoquinol methylase